MKKREPLKYYTDGLKQGDRAVLAKAITLVESSNEEDEKLAIALMDAVIQWPTNSMRVAVTGTPGVGKSTFIEALGMGIINANNKVAVLTIDPSSPVSKGSILGDKSRMSQLSIHPQAFVRPSASGDFLGGVARKTYEAIQLCEAAGYDVILVETVGVGQAEGLVKSMVDFFLLLLQPGSGDVLQTIKRGILEMADAMLINKADGQLKEFATRMLSDYRNHFQTTTTPAGWPVRVMEISALKNEGVQAVWEMLLKYKSFASENGFFQNNRRSQLRLFFNQSLEQEFKKRMEKDEKFMQQYQTFESSVTDRKISPYHAALQLVDKMFTSSPE